MIAPLLSVTLTVPFALLDSVYLKSFLFMLPFCDKFTFLIEVNISSLLFYTNLKLFYDFTRSSKVILR